MALQDESVEYASVISLPALGVCIIHAHAVWLHIDSERLGALALSFFTMTSKKEAGGRQESLPCQPPFIPFFHPPFSLT